mgnify:CR=1
MIQLKEVTTEQEYKEDISLFREYAQDLGIDLSFQNFEQELQEITVQYARPNGALVVAFNDCKQPLGCVGVRKLEPKICELKRMYIKAEARGKGLGKQLLSKALVIAKELKYEIMRLDTLGTMDAAMGLYKITGFYEIPPYRFNPLENARYFEIQLDA